MLVGLVSSRFRQIRSIVCQNKFQLTVRQSSSSTVSTISGLFQSIFGRCSTNIGSVTVMPKAVDFDTVVVSEPISPSANPESASLKAHHGKGRFVIPWPSFGKGDINFFDIMQSRLSGEWKSVDIKPDMFPLVRPELAVPPSNSDAVRATWLGHASFYVEMPRSGLRILFDPLLGQKCAPTWAPGFNRVSESPVSVDELPGVDAVIISHSHYDHLDNYSIDLISQRFPGSCYIVPLGVKRWFTAKNITNVVELDWWDERDVSVRGQRATISCLPAQHISNRTFTDHGKALCASFSISSDTRRLYFAGDTGYRAVPKLNPDQDDYAIDMPSCPAFKEIGKFRGPFDLALLPIGAYSPRHIMSRVHSNPMDSVNIFKDVQAKRAIAMHYGTFVLTDEPLPEPVVKLKDALRLSGIAETGIFDAIKVGQSVEI
ncbi:beta-lactamase superfamily domain-containing protein [Lipomyces oligophaga]|uniref:beta-lactamase superfamily domain-containing protein n=1 Tax=Lipomyces oligophaga TaxID=45792 RepID=UPI0034CEEBFC